MQCMCMIIIEQCIDVLTGGIPQKNHSYNLNNEVSDINHIFLKEFLC